MSRNAPAFRGGLPVAGSVLAVALASTSVVSLAEAPGVAPTARAQAMPGVEMSEAASAVGPMPGTTRTVVPYAVPPLVLLRQDNQRVLLSDELNDGRPVVMNFIFTTCSGICPLASQTFALLQRKLGAGRDRVHLVSISIDPEEDTPKRLREYAHRFSAGPSWQYYTGTAEASVAVQRAFDVYKGDKMDHTPVTLLRMRPDGPWVRFDGFATADMLMRELSIKGPVTAAASSPGK